MLTTLEDDDGNEIALPLRWAICDECRGEGKHSHAVDGNGITSSEWDEWDVEERETYMRGGYDRTCEVCRGAGKVQVVDEAKLSPELLLRYREAQQSLAESYHISRMERLMGA